MCDESDGDGEYVSSFLDGARLDASVAENILAPYPELWAQWQAQVLAPDAKIDLGQGGFRRYHSPTYLHCVVRQHLHLAQGGDELDPELEALCEEIASTYPGLAEQRRRELNDPWWRALDAPKDYNQWIANYYDPQDLKSRIAGLRVADDPFSAHAIETREFEEAFQAAISGKDGSAPFN